eukprot:CAMPEP_0175071914 /NCGR_PEP_ID=MMETSP0052_2-20121109/19555_1 /TAXON_ID=51329 ORGANISM="Polytomella parva, Strain SAG 63-3" /NCGR_SAMPLE_ID=MMETSP0052_2 /ASSEMBLY_ACC=CAM_ASM_000194 /LENGTH=409 /DNA_ID=CAMNT_0016339233 /DNA_START=38 /DNA_END=1264 /DNA_ORIENTATION=-
MATAARSRQSAITKSDMEASRLVFVYLRGVKPKRKVAVPIPEKYSWDSFLRQIKLKLRINEVDEIYFAVSGQKVTSLEELQDIDELCVVEGVAKPNPLPDVIVKGQDATASAFRNRHSSPSDRIATLPPSSVSGGNIGGSPTHHDIVSAAATAANVAAASGVSPSHATLQNSHMLSTQGINYDNNAPCSDDPSPNSSLGGANNSSNSGGGSNYNTTNTHHFHHKYLNGVGGSPPTHVINTSTNTSSSALTSGQPSSSKSMVAMGMLGGNGTHSNGSSGVHSAISLNNGNSNSITEGGGEDSKEKYGKYGKPTGTSAWRRRLQRMFPSLYRVIFSDPLLLPLSVRDLDGVESTNTTSNGSRSLMISSVASVNTGGAARRRGSSRRCSTLLLLRGTFLILAIICCLFTMYW